MIQAMILSLHGVYYIANDPSNDIIITWCLLYSKCKAMLSISILCNTKCLGNNKARNEDFNLKKPTSP